VVASGHDLPRMETLGSDRFEFLFDHDTDGEIALLIRDYFKGASLPGRDFYRALQDIRGAINRAKNGGAR